MKFFQVIKSERSPTLRELAAATVVTFIPEQDFIPHDETFSRWRKRRAARSQEEQNSPPPPIAILSSSRLYQSAFRIKRRKGQLKGLSLNSSHAIIFSPKVAERY